MTQETYLRQKRELEQKQYNAMVQGQDRLVEAIDERLEKLEEDYFG